MTTVIKGDTKTNNVQGDVFLSQTNDGGEIIVEGGLTKLHSGFETAFYLSLFGGNEDDDGSENSVNQWWGNLTEVESFKYRSRTQHALDTIPPSSGNLLKIEAAVRTDLQWFIDEAVANSVTVNVSIPGYNQVLIEGSIDADGNPIDFRFFENWRAAV